jgi:group I intron endonuclease
MKISGIYKIESKTKPERIYIGSSIDIIDRWQKHLRSLKNNKHHSVKFQRHFNKYGKNDLVFSIIIGCIKEDLIITEQFFIDIYDPYFNACKIAGNTLGYKHTEETKKKKSIIMIGNSYSKGRPAWNKGKKNIYSEETKNKMGKSMKGRIPWNKGEKGCFSKESIKKMSISRIGNKNGIGNKNYLKRKKYLKVI